MRSPKQLNGNQPATQADLGLLAGQLTTRLDAIEERMVTKDDLKQFVTKDYLASQLAALESRLDEKLGRILKIVESNAGQLQQMVDHGERIARLEDKVEALEMKA